jgi:hypothetical protein
VSAGALHHFFARPFSEHERKKFVMASLKDAARTLFKVRVKRKVPTSKRYPKSGSFIVRADAQMLVTPELSEELWEWLVLQGWRVNSFSQDRRQYAEWPANSIAILAKAPAGERENLYRRLMAGLVKH